jgi:hypothetical protein
MLSDVEKLKNKYGDNFTMITSEIQFRYQLEQGNLLCFEHNNGSIFLQIDKDSNNLQFMNQEKFKELVTYEVEFEKGIQTIIENFDIKDFFVLFDAKLEIVKSSKFRVLINKIICKLRNF